MLAATTRRARAHARDVIGVAGVGQLTDLTTEEIDHRHHDQHRQDRPRRDDGGVTNADDVAEAEQGGDRRDADVEADTAADAEQLDAREVGVPEVECLDREVKEGADGEGNQQNLTGAAARALARDQNIVVSNKPFNYCS